MCLYWSVSGCCVLVLAVSGCCVLVLVSEWLLCACTGQSVVQGCGQDTVVCGVVVLVMAAVFLALSQELQGAPDDPGMTGDEASTPEQCLAKLTALIK